MLTRRKAALIGLVLLLAPTAARAQGEEVFKKVTAERLEKILKDMNLDYKKAPLDKATNSFTYDFDRNNSKLRLYNYGGLDLMLDVVMAKADWEAVNKWNKSAKFSRASLHKDKLGEFVMLESNLDCVGGITEGAIKQFLNQFNEEIHQYQLANLGPPVEEETFKTVADDKLEKILQGMNIQFKKSANVNATATFFDFQKGKYKFRLTSFEGKDLMIEVHFKKVELDVVNKWNLKRSFIRAVVYDGKEEYTGLEANLDCSGGVSDSIIRYFVRTFETEAQQFDQHLNGGGKK